MVFGKYKTPEFGKGEVGNVANKGLHVEEQNKLSTKIEGLFVCTVIPANCAKQTCVGCETSELNFVSCTTALFGLGSFLESKEHEFMKLSKVHTDNKMSA